MIHWQDEIGVIIMNKFAKQCNIYRVQECSFGHSGTFGQFRF